MSIGSRQSTISGQSRNSTADRQDRYSTPVTLTQNGKSTAN
jgi:hypothetical protein